MIDPLNLIRTALVGIIDGDTDTTTHTVRTLCNRASDFVCAVEHLRFDRPLPVLTYFLYAWTQTPQNGETWNGFVRISAFADGGDAQETVDLLLRRVEQLMTWTNFNAFGADAAPLVFRRLDPLGDLDREGTRGIVRGDLEFEMTLQVGT